MEENEYVEEVCRPGSGRDTCPYLAFSVGGWMCGEVDPMVKAVIEKRKGSFVPNCRQEPVRRPVICRGKPIIRTCEHCKKDYAYGNNELDLRKDHEYVICPYCKMAGPRIEDLKTEQKDESGGILADLKLPDGWTELENVDGVFINRLKDKVIITGTPRDEEGNNHNCDLMGCGTLSHVLMVIAVHDMTDGRG